MQNQTDTIIQQSDFFAIISLFRYGKNVYKELFISIFFIIIAAGLLMTSAKLMGSLAEVLTSSVDNLNLVIMIILKILCMECLHIAACYYSRIRMSQVTNRVTFFIRKELFKKLTRLPITYFDHHALGHTITRLTSDIEGIDGFFSGTLPKVMTASITALSVLVAMLITDLRMGIIITLSSTPALLFIIIMRKPVRVSIQDYKMRSANINALLAEFISGLSVIKIFGLEHWTDKCLKKSSEDLLHSAFLTMNWNTFIRPLVALLCTLPIVIILYWGGHQVLDRIISLNLLVAFIRYGESYFRPIMQLSFELHLIQEAISSSERVRKILEEKEEIDILGPSGIVEQKVLGEVEFRSICMNYGKPEPVLHNISFHAKAGMSIGLVGKTGSGKSTAINLIPQLYAFERGDLLIDGISIQEWNREHLRKHIGIVSQDVIIFRGTLRENLLITTPHASKINDNDIMKLSERTGLDQIIKKLPGGLDTILYDSGSNLSMGERQLLAFTRILLQSPTILLLDEATANIDEHCENLIQKAILELLVDRTCFIIAHRLSTIQHCDKILVFDNGQIIEQGQHEHLLVTNGIYANLVRRQLVNLTK